jgi:hypothetical protein
MRRSIRWAWTLQNRERMRLATEIGQARDLMRLLRKQRAGYKWTAAERKTIKLHLRRLVALSPYLVLLVSPGGFLALPILAWWLDRRSQKQGDKAGEQNTPVN